MRRSVAFRLSVSFAVLFAVGFTAIFGMLYWLLGQQLELREQEALKMRLRQYADIYGALGVRGLDQRVYEDSHTPHVRSLFIRLIGPQGDVWARIPPDWFDKDVKSVMVPDQEGGTTEKQVYTWRAPRDEQEDLIALSMVLSNGLILQVARSTDNRTALLEPLRRTFIKVGAAVVLVGSLLGWFAAHRAVRPLQGVVDTARRIINTGAMDARVTVPKTKDDIAELVGLFNTVLDKNAGLLRAMREALDNVAHDLRTPLTSMRGNAELALAKGDEVGMREALADNVERADLVLRLLRSLMEISEAEAGVLKLDRVPCDMCEMARAATDLYSDVAEDRNISLETNLPDTPMNVLGDTIRLRQVTANLIDNALKYTPSGGHVWVTVSTQPDSTANGAPQVIMTVRDTGPGVPESEQTRIWERLYRCDQSRSQSGLGLGLSMVRAIVEAHGGGVSVKNSPEGGAIFEVRLAAIV